MTAWLLLPLRILLLLLLVVVLPQVWILARLHRAIEGRMCPAPARRPAPIIPPGWLSDSIVRALFEAHEQQLRSGKQLWH